VALPALILTFTLDTIGRYLRPELYNEGWGFSSQHIWLQYLAGFTFTNELWWKQVYVGSDLPYWSLGYEVWYYIIFALFFFLRGAKRYWLTGLACLVAGPKILALFPIWLLGFFVYHVSKRQIFPRWLCVTVLAATAATLGTKFYFAAHGDHLETSELVRYLHGMVFALNIVAVRGLAGSFNWITRFEKPIDWLAGLTFTLYLFHLPVAQFLASLLQAPPKTLAGRLAMLAVTFLIVAVIAEFTERRKKAWRAAVSKILARFEKGSRPALGEA
jgi:peptidoglycan/LPS O-acetylase OafA/YrhL